MVPNKNICIPPKTGEGREQNVAAILENRPSSISKNAANHPALRDAHPVSKMTPLLAAWDTIGIPPPTAPSKLPNASHIIPPWTRD
ncbi:hypothetical protein OGAPHI_003438 [Ogataea philodendri]|uniref:Uncharacterized protein n=1 Tax=Ogataea philodendri TaxID=1378263 RepID=A0A9P8P847_9ASCO|nr:uncharacterized protein OGAPHI_003438 [Ogataea philodendri]KAH3666582.1 hypothetical protein OGAPHI_003438 [Ogataea philodendri]